MIVGDIKVWNKKPEAYFKYATSKKNIKKVNSGILKLDCKPVELYALLDSQLGLKPNGVYTSLISGYPMTNPIWWDFIIESSIGYINVVRTNSRLEAQYGLDDKDFDIKKFFKQNIKKYRKDIDEKMKTYELHKTFINHFYSYKKCAEYLSKEIEKLVLNEPHLPTSHVMSKKTSENYSKEMERYISESIKFHALGKSLVLNSAFAVDSFINLLIRLGSEVYLNKQKHLIRLHLNSNFETRLRNLYALSTIFKDEIDLQNETIKDCLQLMTLRNKYVHSDESSPINYLGNVRFDDLYPLFETPVNGPIVDNIRKTYHHPTYEEVIWAYKNIEKIVIYIKTLVRDEYLELFDTYTEQNPIGYNTGTNRYSVIYPGDMTTFSFIGYE